MFHEGDLQSGIAHAMQTQKAVLCFVADDAETSTEWESILAEDSIRQSLSEQAIAIKMRAGSQEAGFLSPICPIESTPAIVLIKNAVLQANLQSSQTSIVTLRQKLGELFPPSAPQETVCTTDPTTEQPQEPTSTPAVPLHSTSTASSPGYLVLPSSEGQPRLPNNAYEALREYTLSLQTAGKTDREIFEAQLTVLGKLPIFKDEVRRLTSLNPGTAPELSQNARERLLLRLPGVAVKAQLKGPSQGQTARSTSTSTPASNPTPEAAAPAYEFVYPPSAQPPPAQPAAQSQPHQALLTSPPTTASAPPTQPPSYASLSESQRDQAAEYRRQQKSREQKARDERERIKAQIKADREERRRREAVSKQNELAASTGADGDAGPGVDSPAAVTPGSESSHTSTARQTHAQTNAQIRVQIRTLDGTPLSLPPLPPTSTIAASIRPWLDAHPLLASQTNNSAIPYDFKLILTPQPNRKIEASEETLELRELGVRGSCTFVIAPVRGFVESYSGSGGGIPGVGIVGGLVGGGVSLVSGAAGWLGGMLGYGGANSAGGAAVGSAVGSAGGSGSGGAGGGADAGAQQQQQQEGNRGAAGRSVRMRTLADQRAEEQGKNQFYNGNTLNFEPNRDQDEGKGKGKGKED